MAQKKWVFVGTYTQPLPPGSDSPAKGEGIYCFALDMDQGTLHLHGQTTDIHNPSYLALDRTGRFLYAVHELWEFEGKPQGAVSAFAVDPLDRRLTLLSRQGSESPGPCHLALDEGGACCYVSHYQGGSVSLFPIGEGGRLEPASQCIHHKAQGVPPGSPAIPHPHSLLLDRQNRHAFVLDLGLDKLMAYVPDFQRHRLTPAPAPWYGFPAGSGPRHGVFSRDGRFCYVVHEIASAVSVLAYQEDTGVFTAVQTLPCVIDASFSGWTASADIHLHPSGAFLYASNRGHDSIVLYAVDRSTGRLTHVNHTPSGGKTPRGFALDSSGAYLLAANQDSDSLVVFAVDPAAGTLRQVSEAAVPTPACVLFHEP